MPVTEEQTLTIICDNLACPGNSLPTDDRTGWLFVNGEVYGEPVLPQLVVCSLDCLATFSTKAAAKEELKEGLEAWTGERIDASLPEEEATPTTKTKGSRSKK